MNKRQTVKGGNKTTLYHWKEGVERSSPVYDSSYSKPPVTMAPYPSYNQPITSSNIINPTQTPSLPLNNQPYAPVSPPFNNILPTLPVKTN